MLPTVVRECRAAFGYGGQNSPARESAMQAISKREKLFLRVIVLVAIAIILMFFGLLRGYPTLVY